MFQVDLFLESDLKELSVGYKKQQEDYVCLLCGQIFEEGVIYPSGERLYSASRAIKEHLSVKHESVLNFLLALDKKHTGLSESQVQILQHLGEGKEDAEIAKALGLASSTVRNYRFRLKEKARQARAFLAIMSLVNEVDKTEPFIEPHHSATMLDDRYAVTQKEEEKILRHAFAKDGRLKLFPVKEKKKLVILRAISERFEANREYTEKQVNAILSEVFEDHVTLRRYMIQYGFMTREDDGSVYQKL